jgi:hypothetical protein
VATKAAVFAGIRLRMQIEPFLICGGVRHRDPCFALDRVLAVSSRLRFGSGSPAGAAGGATLGRGERYEIGTGGRAARPGAVEAGAVRRRPGPRRGAAELAGGRSAPGGAVCRRPARRSAQSLPRRLRRRRGVPHPRAGTGHRPGYAGSTPPIARRTTAIRQVIPAPGGGADLLRYGPSSGGGHHPGQGGHGGDSVWRGRALVATRRRRLPDPWAAGAVAIFLLKPLRLALRRRGHV